jgi:PAS domain S-box-containing protein
VAGVLALGLNYLTAPFTAIRPATNVLVALLCGLLAAAGLSTLRRRRLLSERVESAGERERELNRQIALIKGELEATFDAMTDAVVITDARDHVVRANRAYCRLRGVEPEAAIGRLLTELAHGEGDWSVCEICRARREGRHAVVLRKPQDTPIGRYLEIRVDPILNASGERTGAVQVLRDFTEKHMVEAEAEKAGSLLKNLVDAAYDAVYATSLDGRFLWANRRAAELLRQAGESLEGQSSFESIHPEDLARVRSNFTKASAGEARRYEMRYVATDGSTRQALMTNSPIYAGGEIVSVLAVMRDVTEERMVSEQTTRSDKLRALGQLASGVAHNFNNALTAVLGYTQIVQAQVSDPKLTRYLITVEKAALDAAKMVQRIQNFARQRQDEPSASADVNQIVRDALDLTRSRWRDDARAASVEYDIIFRPAEGAVVICDQSALREVFVNLIINALDAMPDGGRLTITASLEVDSVAVSFEDSGCGMSDEVRQRIFEPFYTTKGVKGYGMGLSVSFGIIQRHGGEIQVTSEVDRGSTFLLKLPLMRPALEESVTEESPAAKSASVLVVDDELPIRMLLADLLRARGHKVLTAEDGLSGLRAIEGSRFDLVITDLSMPGADGWTLVYEVRRRWPGTKLMMVTGYGGFAEVAVSGGDSSMVDMLISKPFNIGEIDAKINELLLNDFPIRLR